MRARTQVVLGVAVAASVTAGLLLYVSSSRDEKADPTNADLVGLGASVYSAHCASCHGHQLQGQPDWRERRPDGRLPAPPHDANGHTWHHSDRQLFVITKEGVTGIVPGYQSDMPAYRGILSDREIWAVLAYIKSTWPAVIRERQKARSERGQ